MTRAPKAKAKGRIVQATGKATGHGRAEAVAAQEIDRIIERLDAGIAEEKKAMDALLSRLRTTRIAT
jgi:stalled ribosome rescue protein Dom34